MQIVKQLYVNTTNRLPLIPQPFSNFNNHRSLLKNNQKSNQCQSSQLKSFLQTQKYLQQQINQAKQQYQIMLDLFVSFQKIQQGQIKQTKKLQRRCMKDILDKFYCQHQNCKKYYSSLASLQRHIKIKHSCNKNQPPLLYHDLRPQPNLIDEVELQQTNESAQDQSLEEKEEYIEDELK